MSCFPFSSFASFSFYLFQFFVQKTTLTAFDCCVQKNAVCVGDTQVIEDFSSFFKVINKIL